MPLDNLNHNAQLVGIESIDQDHNNILTTIEAIKVSIIDRESNDTISKLCTQLVLESRNHFDVEERLLLKYFYPDTEAHIGQHMAFTNILSTLLKNLNSQQYSYAIETLKYLTNWFIDHIEHADMRYSLYIQDKIA